MSDDETRCGTAAANQPCARCGEPRHEHRDPTNPGTWTWTVDHTFVSPENERERYLRMMRGE